MAQRDRSDLRPLRRHRAALLGAAALPVVGVLLSLEAACTHDWDAYDPRLGEGAGPGGAGGTGGVGQGGAGSAGGAGQGGAGGACVQGAATPCYTGPASTEGIGVCRGGVLFCDPSGQEVCLGEVLPSVEDCASTVDDDCDDVVNDHCGLWSRRFGGSQDQYPWALAVDAAGAVLITGGLAGTANFGGGALTSLGLRDAYAARLDSAGNHMWSQRWGDADDQVGLGIAADPDGNVYLTGAFAGTLDTGVGTLTSAGMADIFVIKLDPSGAPLWAQRFGDALDDAGVAIAADATGVVIAGEFAGTLDVAGTLHTAVDLLDGFAIKLDATGAPLWSRTFGDAGDDAALGVALDAAGNVLLTGVFEEQVDFGGGPIADAGGVDAFVAKLDAANNHVWSRALGAADLQEGRGIAAAPNGDVLVAGRFATSIDLGGGLQASAGSYDAFVVKLSAAGGYVWGHTWGDGGEQQAQAVATDGSGNVIVGVSAAGHADFGGGPILGAGSDDIVIVKLDPAGEHLFSRRFGDPADQDPRGIATDAQGNILVAGECGGTVNFGVGPMYSGGDDDICVAKIAP